MKKYISILLSFLMLASFIATPVAAVEESKVSATLVYSADEAAPQAVKILSTNGLEEYIKEYHQGHAPIGFDIKKYDNEFFQNRSLLFTLVTTTGSGPAFTIESIKETDTSIIIELARPDEPTTPDMASWILVLEIDRDMQDKEIWVNSTKIVGLPYHVFANTTCDITATSNCGGTVGGLGYYPSGGQVTLRALPTVGYSFEGWYEKGKKLEDVGPIYSFVAETDRNLEARFFRGPSPFVDVPADSNSWSYDSIMYCYNAEPCLMNGISNELFLPNGSLNRAMAATVLYRLAGEPEIDEKCSFSDVPEKKYYTKAVVWCERNSIVNGYPDGTFRPNESITREQLAAILYRYAKMEKKSKEIHEDPVNFPDATDVHPYAREAMAWAIDAKLINGVGVQGKSYLQPNNNATRAQFATIISRYLGSVEQ